MDTYGVLKCYIDIIKFKALTRIFHSLLCSFTAITSSKSLINFSLLNKAEH